MTWTIRLHSMWACRVVLCCGLFRISLLIHHPPVLCSKSFRCCRPGRAVGVMSAMLIVQNVQPLLPFTADILQHSASERFVVERSKGRGCWRLGGSRCWPVVPLTSQRAPARNSTTKRDGFWTCLYAKCRRNRWQARLGWATKLLAKKSFPKQNAESSSCTSYCIDAAADIHSLKLPNSFSSRQVNWCRSSLKGHPCHWASAFMCDAYNRWVQWSKADCRCAFAQCIQCQTGQSNRDVGMLMRLMASHTHPRSWAVVCCH